jgi:hypothetical protein
MAGCNDGVCCCLTETGTLLGKWWRSMTPRRAVTKNQSSSQSGTLAKIGNLNFPYIPNICDSQDLGNGLTKKWSLGKWEAKAVFWPAASRIFAKCPSNSFLKCSVCICGLPFFTTAHTASCTWEFLHANVGHAAVTLRVIRVGLLPKVS